MDTPIGVLWACKFFCIGVLTDCGNICYYHSRVVSANTPPRQSAVVELKIKQSMYDCNLPLVLSKGELSMKVRPLADRILVKREEPNETVRGGIIIPDTAKEKPQEGKVIAVGPGRLDESGNRVPVEVKEGDRILMGKYAGTEVKIDGEDHLIMREDDVLAVIE